jgi:hypothetical protein
VAVVVVVCVRRGDENAFTLISKISSNRVLGKVGNAMNLVSGVAECMVNQRMNAWQRSCITGKARFTPFHNQSQWLCLCMVVVRGGGGRW